MRTVQEPEALKAYYVEHAAELSASQAGALRRLIEAEEYGATRAPQPLPTRRTDTDDEFTRLGSIEISDSDPAQHYDDALASIQSLSAADYNAYHQSYQQRNYFEQNLGSLDLPEGGEALRSYYVEQSETLSPSQQGALRRYIEAVDNGGISDRPQTLPQREVTGTGTPDPTGTLVPNPEVERTVTDEIQLRTPDESEVFGPAPRPVEEGTRAEGEAVTTEASETSQPDPARVETPEAPEVEGAVRPIEEGARVEGETHPIETPELSQADPSRVETPEGAGAETPARLIEEGAGVQGETRPVETPESPQAESPRVETPEGAETEAVRSTATEGTPEVPETRVPISQEVPEGALPQAPASISDEEFRSLQSLSTEDIEAGESIDGWI